MPHAAFAHESKTAKLTTIVLAPLFLTLCALSVLGMLVLQGYFFFALRWRAWWTGQRYYLICTPRHGWRSFIDNNLLAALPPSVAPIWTDGRYGVWRTLECEVIGYRASGLSKPCLVEITPLRSRARSLNALLLPYKHFGRKDEVVQEILAELWAGAIEG